MTKQEFLIELAKAEIATQSQMRIGTPEIYWEEFDYWTASQFREAITAACRDVNRFPTIRMIHANKPTSYKTGAVERINHDRDQYRAVVFKANHEVPEDIANLTDDRLREVFTAAGLRDSTHGFHLGNVRRGSLMWIDFVRDTLRTMV